MFEKYCRWYAMPTETLRHYGVGPALGARFADLYLVGRRAPPRWCKAAAAAVVVVVVVVVLVEPTTHTSWGNAACLAIADAWDVESEVVATQAGNAIFVRS